MPNVLFWGTSFVLTSINPPLKSAGYCAAGDFTIIRLSNCDDGIISKEKALESDSLLGTELPFIHTLLYLCERPRTITNLPSIILIPGTRLITSAASLSWVRVICWAETPVWTTRLFFIADNRPISEFFFKTPFTTTSPRVCDSGLISNSISEVPFNTKFTFWL